MHKRRKQPIPEAFLYGWALPLCPLVSLVVVVFIVAASAAVIAMFLYQWAQAPYIVYSQHHLVGWYSTLPV